MIILYEYHIKQPDAVVGAAADFYSLFLEYAHPGCGLAGVEHLGVQALEACLILCCGGGYAAHALHDIEYGTLGLQQRTHRTLDHKGYVTGLDPGAVTDAHAHLQHRVKSLKYAARYLYAG